MVPVADGSDMMGSLRNPAAFNNVYGFRPSFGRVPAGPAPEIFMQQLSTDGPMARTMTDLALLLSIQAGRDARAPPSIAEDGVRFTAPLQRELAGARIAWFGNLDGYLPFEPGILELCGGALAALAQVGCVVEDVVPEFPYGHLWNAWCVLRHWLVSARLNDLYKDPAKRESIKPEAIWEIENGLALKAIEISEASRVRSAWYQLMRELFETYEYLALPSAQVFPFEATKHWPSQVAGRQMDTYHRWMEVVVPGSLSGCPVLNVPVAYNVHGASCGRAWMAKDCAVTVSRLPARSGQPGKAFCRTRDLAKMSSGIRCATQQQHG